MPREWYSSIAHYPYECGIGPLFSCSQHTYWDISYYSNCLLRMLYCKAKEE